VTLVLLDNWQTFWWSTMPTVSSESGILLGHDVCQ